MASIRDAGLVVWTKVPPTFSVRKAGVVTWYTPPPTAMLRTVAGYAFQQTPPLGFVRTVAGYVWTGQQLALPLGVTSDLGLYSLINKNTTGVVFSPSNSTLGVPQAITPVNGNNTTISLAGLASSGYGGSVTLTYRRASLAVAFVAGAPLQGISAASTIYALLPSINAAYSLHLSQFDIVDGPVTAGALSVVLTAASTSYMFAPGTTFSVPVLSKTSLLMHFDGATGSNTMVDAVGHTATTIGTAVLSNATSKFGGTSLSVPTVTSGVSIPNAPEFNLSTGDFTLEAWIFPNSIASVNYIASKGLNASFYTNNTTGVLIVITDQNTSWTGGAVVAGVWQHVALTRSGSTMTLWQNGIAVATLASALSFGNNALPLLIGARATANGTTPNGNFNGFIDEVRISNFCRYSATFNPPPQPFTIDGQSPTLAAAIAAGLNPASMGVSASSTTISSILNQISAAYGINLLPGDLVDGPLPTISGSTPLTLTVASGCLSLVPGSTATINLTLAKTVALLHFDVTPPIDTQGHTVTLSGATISATATKFGAAGLLCTTSGAVAQITDAADLALTGDFTVEFFARFSSFATAPPIVASKGGSNGFQAGTDSNLYCYSDAGTQIGKTSTVLTVATMYHVAISRAGTTFRMFINGVLQSTTTDTNAAFSRTGNWILGNKLSAITTSVDEFRISNVARYTAAFTPPAAAFVPD